MKLLLLVAGLLCLKGCSATHPRASVTSAPRPALAAHQEEGGGKEQLALGKKLFVERCSRCHGESGEKPFGGGPPFKQRVIPTEDITRAVNGRFRDRSEEERRAVIRYLQSITPAGTDPAPSRRSPHPD